MTGQAGDERVILREAQREDIPELCLLLEQLFSQEAEFAPDPAAQRRGLQAIIEQPAIGRILLACQDGQVLGMVNLLFSVSTALGARVALLEDMVVDRRARNAGIGGLLLHHAIDFARTQGCRRITLLTDQDNHSAARFYTRQGFQRSPMMPLRLLLDPVWTGPETKNPAG